MMKKISGIFFFIVLLLSSCNYNEVDTKKEIETLEYSYSSWGYCLEYVELNFLSMQGRILKAEFGELSGNCSTQSIDRYTTYDLKQISNIVDLQNYLYESKEKIVVKPKNGKEPTDMPYWSFKMECSNNTKIEYSHTIFYTKDKIDEMVGKIYDVFETN